MYPFTSLRGLPPFNASHQSLSRFRDSPDFLCTISKPTSGDTPIGVRSSPLSNSMELVEKNFAPISPFTEILPFRFLLIRCLSMLYRNKMECCEVPRAANVGLNPIFVLNSISIQFSGMPTDNCSPEYFQKKKSGIE